MKRSSSSQILPAAADLALRGAGLALLAAAILAATTLLGRAQVDPALRVDALAYLLAGIAFLGASAGTGLLLFGRHLLDRVAISAKSRL
jgi:drug/metabolite transporter (DMT)-like permease